MVPNEIKEKVSRPSILSIFYFLLGGLIKLIVDILIEYELKALTFPTFLVFLLLIIIIFVRFISNEKQNYENISNELKKNIRFCSDIITDLQERYIMMIKRIREAEESIFIYSNLPGANKESQNMNNENVFHKDFLNALNTKCQNDRIEVIRIITPDLTVDCNNDASIREYYESIKENQIYLDHFELLEKKNCLLGLAKAPRGISILFIDNKYLFLIMGKEYSSDENDNGNNKLQRQLKNGFYFEEYNSENSLLKSTFGRCFSEMRNQATEVRKFIQ